MFSSGKVKHFDSLVRKWGVVKDFVVSLITKRTDFAKIIYIFISEILVNGHALQSQEKFSSTIHSRYQNEYFHKCIVICLTVAGDM